MKLLKEKRLALGYTQTEVAKLTNVSLTSYRLWEQGVTKPTEENMDKLKKVLKIKLEE